MRALVAPGLVYVETGTGRRVERVDMVMDALAAWRAAFSDVTTSGVLAASGGRLECWAALG